MKTLWISDLHLEERKTLFYINKLFPLILKSALEEGCKTIVNTGDTFHNHNELLGTELELYKHFADQCKSLGIRLITVVGNHDICKPTKPNTEEVFSYIHSLEGFESENHTIVDKPMIINIEGTEVGLSPYCLTRAHYAEMLNTLKGKVTSVMGHFDCDGFKYTPESGEIVDKWMTQDDFVHFENVYSGHYHQHQEKIINGTTRFVYLGTQYTTNHGQTNQDKFIAVLDLSKASMKLIQTPFTLHKTIRIKAGEDIPKMDLSDKENGVDVRLMISGTMEEIKSIKIPKEFMGKTSHKVITKEVKRLDISASDDKLSSFKMYRDFKFKEKYPDQSKNPLDPQRLEALAARLLGARIKTDERG
jgi:DNA repair exonuclease SbcCD nuclease subunit